MLQHTQCLLQACPYLPPTNRDRDITCPTGVPGRGDKAASAPRIHVSPIMPEQGHSQHGTQGSMSWHWRVWRCNWKGNLCRFLRSYLKNLPPAGLNSSLMPVPPESPARHCPASLCKQLHQSSLQLQMHQGTCLVPEQGLKHSSQLLPFYH